MAYAVLGQGDLSVAIYLLVGTTCALHIASIFWRAWNNTLRNTPRTTSKRQKEIWFFVALAVVALLAHYWLLNQQALRQSILDVETSVTSAVHQGFHKAGSLGGKVVVRPNEAPNGLPGRNYKSDVHVEEVKAKMYKAAKEVKAKVEPRIAELFGMPFQDDRLEPDFTFDILVQSFKRFWWSQQWATGFVVWSIFVGSEVRLRNLPSATAASFVVLVWFLGLACTQNLFYILLLLVPPIRAYRAVMQATHPVAAVLPILWQFACILSAPSLVGTDFFPYLCFAIVTVPLVFAVFGSALPISWGRAPRNAMKPKRVRQLAWSIVSWVCLFLHLWTTVNGIIENIPPGESRWNMTKWFSYKPKAARSERVGSAALAILGSLSDHPLINAVGWDVLLSAVSLCCWSVVGRVDAEGILVCSLAPWHQTLWNGKVAARTQEAAKYLGFSGPRRSSIAERIESLPSGYWDPLSPDWLRNSSGKIRSLSSPKKRGRPRKEEASYDVPDTVRSRPVSRSLSRSKRQVSQEQGGRRKASKSPSPTKRSASHGRRRSARVSQKPSRYEDEDFDNGEPENNDSAVQSVLQGTKSALHGAGNVLHDAGSMLHDAPVEEAEGAALTWSLFAIGGLGMASSAVFGAEAVG